MTADNQSILCGACRVPIEGPTDGMSDNVFTCPSCGRSETRENILKEVKAFVTELAQGSLEESMRKVARSSNFIELKVKPTQKKTYQFVTNHKF